jgi:hypothetical protein
MLMAPLPCHLRISADTGNIPRLIDKDAEIALITLEHFNRFNSGSREEMDTGRIGYLDNLSRTSQPQTITHHNND